MSSPIDIKAVMDAMGDAEEARNQPIRVHVYADDTAPIDLVNIAFAATRSTSGNAVVVHDAYPSTGSIPDASADMGLLVAGESADTGRVYRSLQSVGVPVAVLSANTHKTIAIAAEAGCAIPEKDIIGPDAEPDEKALPDRTSASEIVLDSNDAKAMLNRLGRWIVDVFHEKRVAFAYAFPYVRRPLALESVNSTAVQNAGIGFVAIIPGADMPLMTLNQVKMLLEIAAAYGEELSLGRIKEIVAVIGGAFACRAVARQVVGAVPGVGWVVKGGIGYAGTIAMGHALLQYFEQGADVGATAQSATENVKNLPTWLGISSDKSIVENVKLTANAAKDAVTKAAGDAARNVGPTVVNLADAAGSATGFSKEDLANMAGKLTGSLKDRFTK